MVIAVAVSIKFGRLPVQTQYPSKGSCKRLKAGIFAVCFGVFIETYSVSNAAPGQKVDLPLLTNNNSHPVSELAGGMVIFVTSYIY